MKNYSIFTKLSIVINFITTFLLLFLFFQNSHLTPLILHFIYNFGDFVGNKYNLLYILAVI